MNHKTVLLIIILFLSYKQICAIDPIEAGARSNATANANSTQLDIFSLFNNQAASAFLHKKELSIFSENKYISKELNTIGLAVVLPSAKGTLGITLSRFGFSNFNQTQLGAVIAKKLSHNLSLGIRINYLNTFIKHYSSRGIVFGELGIYTKLTDKISLGAHIHNPTRPKLREGENQQTASIFKVGFSYTEQKLYSLYFDLNKNSEEDFNAKVGLEYFLLQIVTLRAGVNTAPSQFFGGIGILAKQIAIDFSTSYLNNLGFSPSLSLTYAL